MSTDFIKYSSYQDMGIGLLLGKAGSILMDSYRRGAFAMDSPTIYIDELKNRPLNAIMPYGGGFVGYLYFYNLPMSQRIIAGLFGGIIGHMASEMLVL